MGLFSFLKNAGTALIGGGKKTTPTPASPTAGGGAMQELADTQLAMRLTSQVVGLGLKVDNLNIEVHDDKATIYGTVSSTAEREKVILAVGNVAGIATVDDRISVNAPAPEPPATFYEVKKGDTLSKIAKDQYGSANKYMVIFEANKPMLAHPDKIYPGQMLRIPPLAA